LSARRKIPLSPPFSKGEAALAAHDYFRIRVSPPGRSELGRSRRRDGCGCAPQSWVCCTAGCLGAQSAAGTNSVARHLYVLRRRKPGVRLHRIRLQFPTATTRTVNRGRTWSANEGEPSLAGVLHRTRGGLHAGIYVILTGCDWLVDGRAECGYCRSSVLSWLAGSAGWHWKRVGIGRAGVSAVLPSCDTKAITAPLKWFSLAHPLPGSRWCPAKLVLAGRIESA
jgi:hypothetical protein